LQGDILNGRVCPDPVFKPLRASAGSPFRQLVGLWTKGFKNMKIKFSISSKLLLLILPLVCLLVSAVGYFSIQESTERVNRLVRQELMVEIKATANKINHIFYYCRMDLETLSRLPVLEEYLIARSFRLEAEAEFNYDNIVRLFKDFIVRTPDYFQIRYLNKHGRELVKVRKEGPVKEMKKQSELDFFKKSKDKGFKEFYVSDILESSSKKGLVIHYIKPIFSGWKEFAGAVVIDLDYEKIMAIVGNIQVGDKGYAFLIDQLGRNVAHPLFPPYRYGVETYPDRSLKELVLDMMAGGSGWKNYSFEGVNKVAAFAFIPIMGWSIAATIPSVELKKEARAIRRRILQVVVITLLLTVVGVTLLSYYLMRPIRNLVTATNHISKGDLSHEIPVRTRDELGDLTRSFNRMTKNLSRIQNELIRSEKLISLGRLSAGVAHEIRNPLNAIKGAVVFLKRKRSRDTLIREYTQLISEEIDRLSSFVTDFLYFSKQSLPRPEPTDMNKLIFSTQNLFRKEAQERDIHFENHLDAWVPLIHADANQLGQVLVNLLINAMDAMPHGGALFFSSKLKRSTGAEDSKDLIHITIEDRGIGIAPENFKSIFDPFFSTKESGTGLGLPLSLGIVENHGGTIEISSQPDVGTTVWVELPVDTGLKGEGSDIEEKEDTVG
jgi:two-component system, NtrC family, sensor kinase